MKSLLDKYQIWKVLLIGILIGCQIDFHPAHVNLTNPK